jgi:hypothetical protein
MRIAGFDHYLTRGVYVAPWVGANGELVLIAIGHRHRLVGEPVAVPIGGSHLDASDVLWARLERDDPEPLLRVI